VQPLQSLTPLSWYVFGVQAEKHASPSKDQRSAIAKLVAAAKLSGQSAEARKKQQIYKSLNDHPRLYQVDVVEQCPPGQALDAWLTTEAGYQVLHHFFSNTAVFLLLDQDWKEDDLVQVLRQIHATASVSSRRRVAVPTDLTW